MNNELAAHWKSEEFHLITNISVYIQMIIEKNPLPKIKIFTTVEGGNKTEDYEYLIDSYKTNFDQSQW